MTWQDAKQDAEELAAGYAAAHSSEEKIVLMLFDTANTFELLRDSNLGSASWSYNTQLVRATARQLRRKYARRVRLVTVVREPYLKWLTESGRNHSPDSLKAYVETLS